MSGPGPEPGGRKEESMELINNQWLLLISLKEINHDNCNDSLIYYQLSNDVAAQGSSQRYQKVAGSIPWSAEVSLGWLLLVCWSGTAAATISEWITVSLIHVNIDRDLINDRYWSMITSGLNAAAALWSLQGDVVCFGQPFNQTPFTKLAL